VHSPLSLAIDPAECEIYLGTRGPKMLRAGAPAADGILAESLFRPELVRWTREQADLKPGGPHICWQTVTILEPGQPLPASARLFTAMLMRTTSPTVLGLLGVSERARARLRDGRLEADDISDDDVRRFIACGTTDEIAAVVAAARDAGITGWTSIFLGEPQQVIDSMRTFAETVISPIRQAIPRR
jgi:hypothetical protein